MRADQASRGRVRRWAPVILWGFATYYLGFIAVNRILAGTGVIVEKTEPRGTATIVESFLWLAGTAVCVLFAVRSLRRARGLSPGQPRRYISATGPTVSPRWGPPIPALAGGVTFILLGLVLVFATNQTAEAARSSYTQGNGVLAHATVTHVVNSGCNGPDCLSSALVTVALDRPVAGRTSTVVHVPYDVPYTNGQPIAVRVDPAEPGYAELPGTPWQTASTVTIGQGVAFGLLVLGCVVIIQSVWTRLRKGTWVPMWPFR